MRQDTSKSLSLLQQIIDDLLASSLPSSLREFRIIDTPLTERVRKAKAFGLADQSRLESFARGQPKLKYASIAVERYHWNTYGLIP